MQIQGFSPNFTLPEDRKRWMKLLGNSVSIPVIDAICKEIIDTGVFDSRNYEESRRKEIHFSNSSHAS